MIPDNWEKDNKMTRIIASLMGESDNRVYIIIEGKDKKSHCYSIDILGKYMPGRAVENIQKALQAFLVDEPSYAEGQLSGRMRLPTRLEIGVEDCDIEPARPKQSGGGI